jgi:hypothetical protein
MPSEDTWVPISELARLMLERSVEYMNAGHFELAEAYHQKSVDAGVEDMIGQLEKGRDE